MHRVLVRAHEDLCVRRDVPFDVRAYVSLCPFNLLSYVSNAGKADRGSGVMFRACHTCSQAPPRLASGEASFPAVPPQVAHLHALFTAQKSVCASDSIGPAACMRHLKVSCSARVGALLCPHDHVSAARHIVMILHDQSCSCMHAPPRSAERSRGLGCL